MWLIAKNLFFKGAKKLIYLYKKYAANIVFPKNRKGNNMSFLSTLFDFIFPLSDTSDFDLAKNLSGTGSDSNEMMAINPATAMPMVGGVSGIDLRGNLWGQSDSSDNRDSCCSEGCFSDLFDSGSMFDFSSTFDSSSIFD